MNRGHRFQSLSLLVVLSSGIALGQTSSQRQALAEALFREGKTGFEKGAYPEACRKFEESLRLDPAAGTQFALALCYEAEGKLASAWVAFQAIVESPSPRADRLATSKKKIHELEPRVPQLSIDVPETSRVAGLEVLLDGVPLGATGWGSSLPVDPGEHRLVARATGRDESTQTIPLRAGEKRRVSIAPLILRPEASPPSVATSAEPPASAPPPPDPPPAAESAPRTARTVGIVIAGVGVVAIGVGAYFGLHALSKKNDANRRCPGSTCADDGALAEIEDARSAARVSTITIGLGAAALVAGSTLFLLSPARSRESGWQVTPRVGLGHAGLALGSSF